MTFNGTLSVGEKKLSNISVYPNPTYGDVIIEGLNVSSIIGIYNIQGSMIEKINVTDIKVNLDLNNYQSGLYLIKVTNEGTSDLFKIIKK